MTETLSAGRLLSGGPISVLHGFAWQSPSSVAALVMFYRRLQ